LGKKKLFFAIHPLSSEEKNSTILELLLKAYEKINIIYVNKKTNILFVNIY